MFQTAHYLLYDSGTEAVRSPRAEAIGEQGEHYDPLFTYNEGDGLAISSSQKSPEMMRLA